MRAAIGILALFVASAGAVKDADDFDDAAPQEDLVPPSTDKPTAATGSPVTPPATGSPIVIEAPETEKPKEAVEVTASPKTAALLSLGAIGGLINEDTAAALSTLDLATLEAFTAAVCMGMSDQECADALNTAVATYCPPEKTAWNCASIIAGVNALRELMALDAATRADRIANGIGCAAIGDATDLLCDPAAPIPLIVPCDDATGGCSYCTGATVASVGGAACPTTATADGRKFAGLSGPVPSEVNVTMNNTWTKSVPESSTWNPVFRNRMADVHALGNETQTEVRDMFMPLTKGNRDMVKLWNADADQKSAMTSYTICNPPNHCSAGGGDDDELPSWAIAIAVVLPVLACLAIGGLVFKLTSKKDEEEEETKEGDEHNPDAGEEAEQDAEKQTTVVTKTETDAEGNTKVTETVEETK